MPNIKRPRIAVLGMGGTITMAPGLHGALVPAKPVKELVATIPLINGIAELEVFHVENLDSTDIGPTHWVKLITRITNLYKDYDGFVVTHGTDTMAYTGGATALGLGPNLHKPVVFTGSQLPLMSAGNDARANMENAIKVAVEGAKRQLGEVMIVFGHRVLRATRSLKISEAEFDAFRSPAFPQIGVIDATGVTFRPEARQFLGSRSPRLDIRPAFDTQVLTIDVMPGLEPQLIDSLVQQNGQRRCSALVLKSLGTGNIPEQFLSVITSALEADVAVFIATKFVGGRSLPLVYESGRRAIELGAASTGDMTDVMVQVKLMWLLGNGVTGSLALQQQLLKDYVGEVTSAEVFNLVPYTVTNRAR